MFELPADIVSTLAPEVKDIIMKPEVLSVFEAAHNAATSGLIANKTALLNEKGQLKAFIDGFGGQDKLKADLEELAARRAAPSKSQDVEAVRSDLGKKLTDKETELNTLRGAIAQEKVHGFIRDAFKDAEDLDLVLPFIEKRVKHVIGADGKVQVEVLKADGTPMLGKLADPASLTDLAEEFKNSEKFGKFFRAENKGGGGATGGKPGSGAANPFAKNTPHWNVTDQSKLYKSNPTLARSLAAAVGITLP